jgi:hypothetical protein
VVARKRTRDALKGLMSRNLQVRKTPEVSAGFDIAISHKY